MIEMTYASKREQVYQPPAVIGNPPWFSPKEYAQASARGITPAEYVRRNDIIKGLYLDCPYDEGDIVYPAKYEDFLKYGAVKIVGVCDDYSKFGFDVKWAKNDNPMIVTFSVCDDLDKTMFCTTNYLSVDCPKPEGEC